MRCYYCARQENVSVVGSAVAVCKRCGGGICLDHLCEVRRERRHAGMLGPTAGPTVELLCLSCSGLDPAEPLKRRGQAGREPALATRGTAPSHRGQTDSEPIWTDPAGVVGAAEAYLAGLRAPTATKGPSVITASAEAPAPSLRRWLSQLWNRFWRS